MFEFLTLKPEAFGLDISDLSLKIIKLDKKGAGFDLASFGKTTIKPGIIKKGEIKKEKNLVEAIKKGLADIKGKKIKTKYVVASLPEEEAFLQVIQMPCLAEEDLKSAVIYEAENYIPLPIEKVYLDSQVIQPLSNHLDHCDVLIAALPKEIVDPYFNCLKEAGLKPLALEIESLSAIRALIKEEKSNFPVLLIDFGATRTSFIIFSGYSLRFTSSIPVSSSKFTEAISQTMKIDLEKAEKLKFKYGLETQGVKEGGEVFEALIPPLTDLIEQIKRHLNYYQSHSVHEHLAPGSKGVEKILLCGGGAYLKGLTSFLSRELKMPVEVADPWINVFPQTQKKPIKPPAGIDDTLCYTTAIGLALRGMKHDKSSTQPI